MVPKEIPITVLMTVYNGGQFLRSSIENVLNQSFQDFELLIVNDGSSDDSLDIIWSYRDPRIVVYSNEKNLGQTPSLNLGLKLARGKYVARMDADDLAFPAWLAELWSFLERNPKVTVVSAKAVVFAPRAGVVRILNAPNRWEEMVLKSLTSPPISHVGSLMRKEVVFQEMGGYDERYHIPADFHLWSRLIRRGYRLAIVPKVLVAIRFHEGNQSKVRNSEEMIRIIHDNVRHLTNYFIQESEAILLYKLSYENFSLNQEEFQRALALLENVYKQVRRSLGVDAFIETTLARQQKTVVMKKLFDCIERGDFEDAQTIIQDYLKRYGWVNSFSLIRLISFGGIIGLRLLPKVYAQVCRFKMQWVLRDKLIPKGIH